MHDPRPNAGRPSARERRLVRTGIACATSLGWHAAALGALALSGALRPVPAGMAVDLRPLPAREWEANRGLGLGGATRQGPREIVPLPPDAERDPAREERPVPGDARRLAERDQTVNGETVSRHAGSYPKLLRVPQEAARGRKGAGERGRAKIAVPGREGPAGGGAPEPAAPAAPSGPGEEMLAAAPATAPTSQPAAPPTADSPLPMDGEDGQRIEGRRISGLPLREYPRPEGGPNLDGLGLEEGPETRLHTRRFTTAAFWSGVRDRIQNEWEKHSLVLVRQRDPDEDTYFYKVRTVLVGLALDATGGVRDVRVIESSRLDFYDALALQTVRQQPYPHPPPSAMGSDGVARINIRLQWLPAPRRGGLR